MLPCAVYGIIPGNAPEPPGNPLGGELVAVLPNGYCGSRITKRREFTDWLDDLDASRYDNLANAFTKSDRSCGVSTHLIHLKR